MGGRTLAGQALRQCYPGEIFLLFVSLSVQFFLALDLHVSVGKKSNPQKQRRKKNDSKSKNALKNLMSCSANYFCSGSFLRERIRRLELILVVLHRCKQDLRYVPYSFDTDPDPAF